MSTGMVLDGIAASEAVDSSGEVLDVEGADISTLATTGTINVEHIPGDRPNEKTVLGEETIGRVLYARKIFERGDCEDDRQRMYWDKVRVPYIYIIYRLYDGAGHRAAQAFAAQIRDAVANNESILVRLSAEGATLEKEGHVLKCSVIQRVSATLKPCNRTCDVGLLKDPNAPPGFEKEPAKDAPKDLLADLVEKNEHEHPLFRKLGGSVEIECNPELGQRESLKAYLRQRVRDKLAKALEAGMPSGAPSTLTGGAALQKEHLKSRAAKLMRGYAKPFDKAEFRAYAKAELPEASDEFLDHFSDIAHDYHTRLRKTIDLEGDRVAQPQGGLKWAAPVKGTKTETKVPQAAPEPPKPGAQQPGVGGGKKRLELRPNGDLVTPSGQTLKFHVPSGPEYMEILHPDLHDIPEEKRQLYKRTVHEPWERAMQNWMEVNKAAREGRLPRSIIKLAGLFSAMSPNTGVPLQERHYGHIMDMLHEGVMNLQEPVNEGHIAEFARRAQGPLLPNWNREHYERNAPPPGVDSWEEAAARAAEPNKFGNEKTDLPQIAGLRHLDDIMPHLEHLFATHGANGRDMAERLMDMKSAYKRQATKLGAAGAKEALAGSHPIVQGFGPKLTRYMLSMAGAGNILVPDRHMTRSLWNVGKDDPISDYLATQVVTKPQNEPILRALDKHFYNNHPAVQDVINRYPEHFKGHEEQAIFPAFWKHWLTIPHYERNQGRDTEATIGGTDHKVFWDSLHDAMRRHGIPVRGSFYDYTPPDTSFDFGANLGKAEPPHPLAHLDLTQRALGALGEVAMKHGEMGALTAFFAHIAPAMLAAEKGRAKHDPHAILRKAEAMIIDLRKAVDDAKRLTQRAPERKVRFAGVDVVPGYARAADGDYDLLHEDDTHYVAVPQGTDSREYPYSLVKFPKSKEGTHYTVSRRPAVHVLDLQE